MGYGVVKPTLGTVMRKCIALTVLLFFCGILFNAGAQIATPTNLFQVLFVVLPMSLVMTAFFSWIMSSLTATLELLQAKRQTYKIQMYKWLYRILAVSGCLVLVFLLSASLIMPQLKTLEGEAKYWRTWWFWRGGFWMTVGGRNPFSLTGMLGGWMNLTYLACFLSIILLWRPTANNARYGLEELGGEDHQDGDGYDLEIATPSNGYLGQNMKKRSPHTSPELDERILFDVSEHLQDHEEDDLYGGGGSGKGGETDEEVVRWAQKNVYAMDNTDGEETDDDIDDEDGQQGSSSGAGRSRGKGGAGNGNGGTIRTEEQEHARKGISKLK